MNVLEAKSLVKTFPGVRAIDDVSVAFVPGTIHGIIGENGAGKSTLVKMLTGVYVPDSGEVLIEGAPGRANPALFGRVAYAPQEIDLFPHMSLAENLFMPFQRAGFRGVLVHQRTLNDAAESWLDRLRISARPSDLIRDISISNQQLVQIARAAANKDCRALILDEPTTSLTSGDVENLFALLRDLRSEGKAIVFISHKLEELRALCDEITVLRNGVAVGHAEMQAVDNKWLIAKMSGRSINEEDVFRPRREAGPVILEVRNLSGRGFSDVSFDVRRGEILGFAGLLGAGRSEIMQTILGTLPATAGTVRFEGSEWRLGSAHRSVSRGFHYLPEERKQQGILPLLSVRENVAITLMDQISTGPVLVRSTENALVRKVVRDFGVQTPDVENPIAHLSGGNQQKVIIGRTISSGPKTLVFDEPTKGIDIGTKVDIYQLMQDLVERQGLSIILISSELEELLRCANRIITVYRGRVWAEFETANSNKDDIIHAMLGGSGETRPGSQA
jgi:ABC-type sugar transport system ATPase subunit